MNNKESESSLVLINSKAIEEILYKQQLILDKIKGFTKSEEELEFITASEWMRRTNTSRSLFDLLRANNTIQVYQRGRRLFLRADSVEKYITGK